MIFTQTILEERLQTILDDPHISVSTTNRPSVLLGAVVYCVQSLKFKIGERPFCFLFEVGSPQLLLRDDGLVSYLLRKHARRGLTAETLPQFRVVERALREHKFTYAFKNPPVRFEHDLRCIFREDQIRSFFVHLYAFTRQNYTPL